MKRQKESKVTKILMLILSLVFFTSTIVSFSISKYVTQKQAHFGDKEHLDYTVNAVFVVRSQEELFAAINQGYTYVQLDQDIENPLIVTQKAETLNTDLILDLNGIEIQRNGYEPILNIKPGVRLTVVDTSVEQTGGLYNPVGSVFNIYGGTLTVVTGNFESGPRYSEYYSYNNYVLDGSNNSQTKRTLVEDAPQRANFYEKDASTGRFKPAEVKNLPIIKSYPEKTGNVEYNHGNLYFDERVEIPGSDLVIEPDTYCYYRTSEDSGVDTSADSMADWYYTYYVSKDNFTYLSHDGNEEDHIKITIFGYYNTIKQASEITDPAKYYAAIQMTSGTLDVQNGTFNQYFGVDTTACVNAQGGDINIKKGKFSSRVPNATYYTEYGKGTKEVDTVCFTSSYFDNYKWNEATTNYISGSYNGRLAKVGESYCILNGGSANVTIGTGDLYSSNNNIISMGGGALSISGGNFTKRVTNGINVADGELTEMAAINMQDGTLDISSATCSVFGDSSAGILMQKGKLTVEQTQFDLQGNVINGIYSLINNDTDFQVLNSSFTLNGNNAVGIYSEYGKVNISADTSALLSIKGDNSYGIYVKNGGSVASTNYSYSLSGAESIGILAESDATGINVTNGEMNIQGNNSFGINSSISGTDTFNVKDLPITMTNGTQQTGIFAQNGTVNVMSTSSKLISIDGAQGKGIHVGDGGSVISNNYSYKLSSDYSYGIYSTAGTVSVTGGDITLDSNNQCYGVYAFSASEKIKVDIDGAEISVGYGITNNKTSDTRASVGVFLATNDNTNKITLIDTNIRCYEVGVLIDGGSLDVKSTTTTANEILTRKASSIIVKGGSVNFDESCNYNITSSTTVNNSTTNVFNITLPTVDEAVNEGYNNYDGIYVDGGNLTSNGKVDITHTGLYNDTPSSYDYNTLVVKSYAVRILGGNVNILKGNITALIGGGIYSGASGALIGNITMGNESSALSDITVKANGNRAGDSYNALGTTDISESWRSNKSITGGHAIELNGGNISVYNGTYEAQFGNGVAANSSGRIEIYNGIFNGWMNANGSALDGKTGPSAFYGLKVVGGAQVVIKGGTFDGGNGGAFVTGVTEVTNRSITKTSTATVLIYAGTFGSTRANLWDAFNIYDDAIVVFGAGDSNYFSTVSEFNNSIKLLSGKTSIAVNRITQYTSQRTAYIYVYYGDYSGGNMWDDGNGDYETYNTRLGYTSVTGVIGEMNNNTAVFNTKQSIISK